nr:hypothetical protein [Hymenobacter guriensis]
MINSIIKTGISLVLPLVLSGEVLAQKCETSVQESYRKLHLDSQANNYRYEKAFFSCFPNSFASFNKLFGYDDKTGPAPLYATSMEYIARFFALRHIPLQQKIAKVLAISLHGTWDSDGVGEFQRSMQKYFLQHPTLFLQALKQHKDTDVKSFWNFYFDYEADDYRAKDFQAVNKVVPKEEIAMHRLIKEAYLERIKAWLIINRSGSADPKRLHRTHQRLVPPRAARRLLVSLAGPRAPVGGPMAARV